MFWNKEIETMSREGMRALQLARLQETVTRTYNNVPFYKKRFDEIGLKPEDIQTLEDIQKIPFTVKNDLRDNYPFGLFGVPMRDIVRIHASSGTTGKPTTVGYTRKDLDNWAECIARLITMAGGTKDDVTQIAFGYGLFTGAFGLHQGMEKIGAAVIPISSGNTEKQLMIMQDFKPTILISTPSYALYMSEVAQEMGITKDDIHLRIGMFGAEGHTEEMRMELEKRWGIVATENYGLSEVMGPGVAGECLEHTGMHINEDMFIIEIIDPETGKVLPEGEKGEVVITPLGKEGIPLLRYRTKDVSWIMSDTCPCGRTTRRLHKIQGRTDDMLIIKGVNVFPSQVEGVLLGIDHISPQYQLVVRKKGYVDDLEVKVELEDASLLENYKALEELRKDIQHKIHTVLGIMVKVSLLEPKSIERTTGKAKHVVDLR